MRNPLNNPLSRWAKAAFPVVAIATIALQAAAPTPARAGVMMEGFYINCPSGYGSQWWWDHLAAQSNTLAGYGFSAIWIPCALKGNSGGYSSGYDPFDDYDLGSKNQKGTYPTHYGNRVQLERACAVIKANGMQVYEDIVDSHRDGSANNYSYQYLDAYGNAGGGRFPKGASDFYPNVPMASDVPDGQTNPDGDWIMPTTGGQYTVNGQTVVYAGYNMEQSGDWLTKALDLDGYRLDDVKASPSSWLYSFLNYGSMAGKFSVGEYYDGNLSSVNGWVTGPLNNRSSAFDFPLKFNCLNPMCNNPGSFNMASLDHAGLTGVNPTESVTFVENHDTDGSSPITQDKLLGYAYILTSEGYPCVYYRDWSTDAGCYGSGMQAGIDNLIWIHEKIASGTTQQRYKTQTLFCYERMGGSHLLVGLSDNTGASQTVTCATGFGANVHLHDYTGHEPDVTTNGSGNATITVPADANGTSYVAYSVAGLGGSFAPAARATTQEYAGAQDLDIKPADPSGTVTAAQVEVAKGASVGESLYYNTASWTASTAIGVQILGPSGAALASKSYTSATAQGASLTATAPATGLYTFNVTATATPSANAKPYYFLKATYTAPSTVIPYSLTVTGANPASGQSVYVTGNIAELGDWTPARGILMNQSGSGATATWNAQVALPPSTAVQYKYVLWNGTTAVYEPNQKTASGNRQITTPATGSVSVSDGAF